MFFLFQGLLCILFSRRTRIEIKINFVFYVFEEGRTQKKRKPRKKKPRPERSYLVSGFNTMFGTSFFD
jgi:hypothetical protein